ncbi:MAG: L-threonylcarbamoyladenylate synthase [Candidatus Caccosoma sp.]|nr:L-threonylcarbamoyladenylate synthase [Candidatus Caccosoma sp.]
METKIYQSKDYKKIIEDLLRGEVVGFPTETVYGLAIVYNSKEAFDKIYQIKNRSITKPISAMVANKDVLKSIAIVDERASKVVDNLMPGSITVILPAKDNLLEHVTFNLKTIGVRIPTNETALKILNEINIPLLVTSANISNEPSLLKAKDVYSKFNGKIASLIDEDAINGVASTVVDLTKKPIKILREGPVSKERIEEVLGE